MPSVVDIANMALSRIGNSQRISDMDEASLQAEQCSLFYEQVRDFVLRDYPWGFARGFESLAQVAVNPDPSFEYAYAQPQDCLKIRRIVGQVNMQAYFIQECLEIPRFPDIPYRVVYGENRPLIATSVSPATLEYTKRITAPETFDPIFVSALAWKLAAEIAPAIAKDASAAQAAEGGYQAQIAQAAASMMNEQHPMRVPESVFISGRD